jgi:hypothetical protein
MFLSQPQKKKKKKNFSPRDFADKQNFFFFWHRLFLMYNKKDDGDNKIKIKKRNDIIF